MAGLSQRDCEHIFGLLSVREALVVSCVCKLWNTILTTDSERIWKDICKNNFGGPLTGKNKSWRIACKSFTKEFKHATSLGYQRQIKWAASGGHVALLRRFQNQGQLAITDLDKPKQLLQVALDKGNFSMVEWCIDFGIPRFMSVDWAQMISKSSFLRAATKGEYFSLLKCAKLELTSDNMYPLLSGIILAGQAEILRHHLQVADRFMLDSFHIFLAAEKDNILVWEVLKEHTLKWGEEKWPELLATMSYSASDRRCAISDAVLHRKLNSFLWLLENGADVGAVTHSGKSLIHCAATKVNHNETASAIPFIETLLTKFGVDVNRVSSAPSFQFNTFRNSPQSHTALHFAVASNDFECVEYLLAHGADMDIHKHYTGPRVVNPVFLEVKDARMGHLLLDLGFDPNVVDSQNRNFFMKIVDYRDLAFLTNNTKDFFPFFERLMQLGVSPKQKNEHQQTVLHKRLSLPIMKWFVEVAGLDINARDEFGRTPLVEAACSYHDPLNAIACVEYLIEKGADKIAHGTAIYLHHESIKETLLKHGVKIEHEDYP